MAVVRTQIGESVWGNKLVRIFHVTDSNYSGGTSMTAAQCGLGTIEMLIPVMVAANTTYGCGWDYVGNKVRVYTSADGVEVTGDISTIAPFRVLVIGV